MRIGILLANLGTPAAPTAKAVRKYLAEFLWDPRVVEIPRPLWWLILHGLVLRLRPKKTAKLYQQIWLENGSPLLVYSQQLANQLTNYFSTAPQKNIPKVLQDATRRERCPGEEGTNEYMSTETSSQPSHNSKEEYRYIVALGMRYGEPSIESALRELQEKQVNQIVILPLYPQYSATTTASMFDACAQVLKQWRNIPAINFVAHYFNHPNYIEVLAERIRQYYQADSHLIFSFHGLPKRCVELGDPYQQQCEQTVALLAEKLQLTPENYSVVFQSRFGAAEWIKPYCDETLRALPQRGVKNVMVVCPGFAVDCLETLEEIAQQNRKIFMQAGGEKFHYIPALNAAAEHAEMLAKIILSSEYP